MGYHLACLNPPLEAVPLDEWFCPGCQDKGLYAVEAIKDKKTMARIDPQTRRRTGGKCVRSTSSSGRVRSGRATTRGSRSTSSRAPT